MSYCVYNLVFPLVSKDTINYGLYPGKQSQIRCRLGRVQEKIDSGGFPRSGGGAGGFLSCQTVNLMYLWREREKPTGWMRARERKVTGKGRVSLM